MEDLIKQLQQAIGPDRKLDAEIWMTLYPEWRAYPRDDHGEGDIAWITPRDGRSYLATRYTGSVDDALSLIPKEMFYILGHGRVRSGEPLCGAQLLRPVTSEVIAEAESDTLPIAICIAALRASDNLKSGDDRGSV